MLSEADGVSGPGLGCWQRTQKRCLDLAVAVPGVVLAAPLMGVAWLVATLTTRRNGLFTQERVGQHGEPFQVLKIRTMRTVGGSTVTSSEDARMTRAGAWMRRLKLDELPQLVNVLRGEMGLVGPRPDVPGFADELRGADRVLLTVRPGITSPAAVAYRHEEALLRAAADPDAYNRTVLWPAKVALNREYVENWSVAADVRCILATLRAVVQRYEANAPSEAPR